MLILINYHVTVIPVKINIGSVHQSTSQYEYQDRSNQSLELSVNEAIGYMKLEQTLARFNPKQFVFKTPKVGVNKYFKK